MPPTLILLVGMATILAGILLLRLNAFLALITAAIVVSLLAPGEAAVKIGRVAEGFGRTAGTVGVVIALAAIAGKAMMDSGAAERIVREFVALLVMHQHCVIAVRGGVSCLAGLRVPPHARKATSRRSCPGRDCGFAVGYAATSRSRSLTPAHPPARAPHFIAHGGRVDDGTTGS